MGMGSVPARVELEVVLQPHQGREEGRAVAEGLMKKLGIESHQLVDVAYVDLLAQRPGGTEPD